MNAYQTSCGSFWSFLFLGSPFLVQNLNGHLTEAGSAGGDQSKSSDEEEGSLPWCVSSFSPSASECQDPYSVLLVWITTALATGAAAYLKSQRTSEVCACARACVCLCACLCALVYVCVCGFCVCILVLGTRILAFPFYEYLGGFVAAVPILAVVVVDLIFF